MRRRPGSGSLRPAPEITARGVAYACARLKIKARIFVPTTTPRQKRDRMIKLGGEYITLVVTGETYDQASKAAKLDAAESGAVLVPPPSTTRG